MTGEKAELSYDAVNRLSRYEASKNGTALLTQESRYNGNGQRVQKKETQSAEVKDNHYYYQGATVLYTSDENNKLSSLNLMGLEGNVIATQRKGEGSGSWYLYNKDVRESTSSIVNSAGELAAAYEYDEFGNTDVQAGESFYNEICYTGQMYDRRTGLYYYNARFYDPEDGRFVSQDTYRGTTKNPSSLHLYTYCYNNPVGNTDPSGHWVYSIGVEAQVSAILGLYGGYAINLDSGWNINVTASVGLMITTNVIAGISGFVAGYSKYNSVDNLRGFGVSVGVAFSFGVKLSGSGGVSLSPNGKMSRAECVSLGTGVSVAPVPYFEIKAGYTRGSRKINLAQILKWKRNKQKTYKVGGMKIGVKRNKTNVRLSSNKIKKKYYIYPQKKSKKKVKKIVLQ